MKLLYCLACQDVVRLIETERRCECGSTGGRYLDTSKAEVFGPAVPFAILNADFQRAIHARTDEWPGVWFGGFIIPRNADNVVEEDGP